MPLHPRGVLLTVLVSTALIGCGSGDPGPPERPGAGAQPVAVGSRTPIPAAKPIASRSGRLDDHPVTLELTQLRRRGRVVQLEMRLTTKGPSFSATMDTFDDGVQEHLTDPAATVSAEDYRTLDGIGLIDGTHGLRYAPARDRFNHCVCDRDLGGLMIAPGAGRPLSATFGAPPPDVKAVDVVFPLFGTIPDVPLG